MKVFAKWRECHSTTGTYFEAYVVNERGDELTIGLSYNKHDFCRMWQSLDVQLQTAPSEDD